MATEKRLIDAIALIDWIDAGHLRSPTEKCFSEWDVVKILRNSPTVDAVEVVRCEKCRYYKKAEYDEGYKMVCRLLKRQTASNGFCYCGEKRDGDGNGC